MYRKMMRLRNDYNKFQFFSKLYDTVAWIDS